MEYILTDIWKGHMCNAKLLKSMPGERGPNGRRTCQLCLDDSILL